MGYNATVVRFLGLLTMYGWMGGVIETIFFAGAIFAALWTLCEASGIPGSQRTLVVLAASSVAIAVIGALSIRPLQWYFIFASLCDFVRTTLNDDVLDSETVLISNGSGGAIICGMLVKAMSASGRGSPLCVVLDLRYDNGRAIIGSLGRIDGAAMGGRKAMMVLSAISTGANLTAMRQLLNGARIPVFAYLVEPAAEGRVACDYFVVKGGRSILPWPRSE